MDEVLSGGEFVPDFATHYYRASRAPFLNLSDLPDEQAVAVMAELTRERREGGPVVERRAGAPLLLTVPVVTAGRVPVPCS